MDYRCISLGFGKGHICAAFWIRFNEDYDWILLFENYDMISASETFWTGLVHYAGGPWLSQCHRTCFIMLCWKIIHFIR